MANLRRPSVAAPGFITLLLVLLVGVTGCRRPIANAAEPEIAPPLTETNGGFRVVASTTIIGDMVSQIAGDRVQLNVILKPGQDPHIYKPIPSDPQLISASNLVLLNGLRLEEYIEKMVRSAVKDQPIVVVSKGIEPIGEGATAGSPDPHIWFDVSYAAVMADNIMHALIEHDAPNASHYRVRGERYIKELVELDQWVRAQLEPLPKERRKLVTSHDAFSYFGHRYGFEVLAVQGISTEASAQARDVAALIDRLREEKVPAVFVETSVNPKMVEQVASEAGVKVGGKLYSDSLGEPGTPAATYVGMVKENVRTILEGLK